MQGESKEPRERSEAAVGWETRDSKIDWDRGWEVATYSTLSVLVAVAAGGAEGARAQGCFR